MSTLPLHCLSDTAAHHFQKRGRARFTRGWRPERIPDFLRSHMPVDAVTSRFCPVSRRRACLDPPRMQRSGWRRRQEGEPDRRRRGVGVSPMLKCSNKTNCKVRADVLPPSSNKQLYKASSAIVHWAQSDSAGLQGTFRTRSFLAAQGFVMRQPNWTAPARLFSCASFI